MVVRSNQNHNSPLITNVINKYFKDSLIFNKIHSFTKHVLVSTVLNKNFCVNCHSVI